MSNLIVGLTGGLGSGKSLAADLFESLGISIIDTDKIAHELTQPNGELFQTLVSNFPNHLLSRDGLLNRTKWREYIFTHPDEKLKLEKILHPRILEIALERAKNASSPYCIMVIPLLFEKNLTHLVNRTLLIYANKSLRSKRILNRDKTTSHIIDAMMTSQIDPEKAKSLSDDIIINDASPQALKQQVSKLHQYYQSLSAT